MRLSLTDIMYMQEDGNLRVEEMERALYPPCMTGEQCQTLSSSWLLIGEPLLIYSLWYAALWTR